ncbi:hypothetical protein [Sphingobium lactosutens]|jgi:hypothetical protein|uniref:hypothetical protein n=1 Tax=Sphingobium lactosutens TaxID=522773 RepID=UPI001D1840BB|nr:hypothetical protein [Sphingobium lactosutens]MCC4257867.1 hypothetical protein [Sphingobium lactosutens]
MSVEGMWAIYYNEVDSGIVTLETGRVFGGDSMMAFVGKYTVNGQEFTAKARTFSYNPAHFAVQNVFGRTGKLDLETQMQGTIEGGRLTGFIFETEQPDQKLPVRMEKLAELP